MHVGQFQTEIPDPFEHAVQRGLVGHPATKVSFLGARCGDLESFERPEHAAADPSADHQFVFAALGTHVVCIVGLFRSGRITRQG